MRPRLLALLLALLPGLAAAGVADVRLCLYGLVGTWTCCSHGEGAEEVATSGCCAGAPAPEARYQAPPPPCELCCVDVVGEPAAVSDPSRGAEPTPGDPRAFALPAWTPPAPEPGARPAPRSPPLRPGAAANLPLRI